MEHISPFSNNPYYLRSDLTFKASNIRTVTYGTETIYFRGSKTWALLPNEIKNSSNLTAFKTKIKNWKPIGCKCRICKTYIPRYGFI